MVRIYDKMLGAVKLLEFFTMRDWQFHSENSIALWDSLSSEDQQVILNYLWLEGKTSNTS